MDSDCWGKGPDCDTKTGAADILYSTGDTLVLLGDEKKGIAIPPKDMFSRFAAVVFDAEEEKGEEPV